MSDMKVFGPVVTTEWCATFSPERELHCLGGQFVVSDVTRKGDDRGARRREFGIESRKAVRKQVDSNHLGAAIGETGARCRADTAGRAGDDSDVSVDFGKPRVRHGILGFVGVHR